VYHVRDRRLYDAIGEPAHPHRRQVPARQVIDRLTRLDAVLADPKLRWLATELEKVAYVGKVVPTFLRLIRFRGHLPKGGYDVPNGQHDQEPATAPAV
jgi:hypothetical protein